MKPNRQTQIHELRQQGLSYKQIAEQLGIAPATVRSSKSASLNNRLSGSLTAREREIADLAANGMKTADIAGFLQLSQRTVNAHRYRISQKLGRT